MFQVAIPTLGRHDSIAKNTLALLQKHGVERSQITVFVIENEYDAYRSTLSDEIKIVIGVPGIVAQRQYIVEHYPENTHLLCCDDDLAEIQGFDGNFMDFINTAFDDLVKHDAYLFGIHPCWNQFFREKNKYMTTYLTFIIGSFYGIRVRHSDDLKTVVALNEKEDCERSLRYFIKDGCVIRYSKIGVKTKQFKRGGMGTLSTRLADTKTDADRIFNHFGLTYCSIRESKKGTAEIKLHEIPQRKSSDVVRLLNPVPPETFDTLYNMLSKITIRMSRTILAKPGSKFKYSSQTRRGFDDHRNACFGVVKQRIRAPGTDLKQQSAYSKKYPAIHDEIFKIGKMICPFEFSSVHLNHNVVCPPHFDSKNTGESVIVSFGDYTGCNLIVNGTEFNAKYQPLTFNGTCLLHYNTPLESGNKYSLVFYNNN